MKPLSTLKALLLILLALSVAGSLSAENVVGNTAGTVTGEGEAISFNPEELIVIRAGDITGFQDGLELRLLIPEGLRRYQNSFALLVFKDISPEPDPDTRFYRGSRVFMRLLPSRDSIFIRIPFSEDHSIAGDALTDVLPVPVKAGDFPLLVTVLPVMKGVPDRAFSEVLTLSAVTLLRDEGTLTVNITNKSDDPEELLSIAVDGNPIQPGEPLSLAAGMHRVRVDSSSAPTIEKNIAIEPGQEAVLDIQLDYTAPEVIVNIPEGAVLLIDGTPIERADEPKVIEMEPGDHTVTYRLGDLEVSRIFNLRPGSRVNIDLLIDISIVDFSESGGNPYGAGDG